MRFKPNKTHAMKLLAVTLSSGLVITASAALSNTPVSVKASSEAPADISSNASGTAPKDMPNGTPPEKPSGDMPGGAPGESSSVTLSGANTADGKSVTYDGNSDSTELTSSSSDENTVLSTNGGTYTLTNATLNKTGDSTSSDSSNFYGLNAILAATKNSTAYISNSALTSASEGSNAIFATGSNAKVYAKNVTINTTGNSSRGLDATYEGTIIASDVNITTTGEHCGAIATDRGGGNISVDGTALSTAGQGSPLIYSTGVIEVNNATGEATGAQIVGMEGLNTVRIKNSTLTGSAKKASEAVSNGVILYQSTSGDSSTGTANFEASDSTLTSKITNGAMFYITNTDANIVLSNTTLNFDEDSNTLLTAGGNDASNGWGSVGSNGGNVTFTAIKENLKGNISCDGISNVTFYLTDGTTYTGTIINDTTYDGDGGVSMNLTSDTKWIVTKDTTIKSLNAASGSSITDSNGNTVTIKTSDGKTVVNGNSDITITTDSYSTDDTSASAGTISEFTVDRTDFNTYYQSNGSSSSDNTSSGTDTSDNTTDSTKDSTSLEVTAKPSATSITSIKSTKKTVTLKWKKVSGSSGYIVYRSTSKNGTYKKIATVKNGKVTYKDTKLKSGKRYYYKVQTYKTTNSKTVYANKSKVKSVKTK